MQLTVCFSFVVSLRVAFPLEKVKFIGHILQMEDMDKILVKKRFSITKTFWIM